MKTIFTLLTTLIMISFFSLKSHATVFIVDVEDDEFDPAVLTINVGDQIMWIWDEGAHTTTSTMIPAGAASWDELIDATATTYTYTATVSGSYDYVCLFHQSMGMVGHFTVLGSTGIPSLPGVPTLTVNSNISSGDPLMVTYQLDATQKLSLKMYDILGKEVHSFFTAVKSAGTYSEQFGLGNIRRGIYFIRLETSDDAAIRKIIVQ